MDWAVWDRTHDRVARESSYMGHEGQCDFYFGYGLDVIEENALNEKSCIQVLRVLNTKANNEILELEEDLITLQSQLAWADESWSEICSSALREKINCLDISIQSLKNTNVQDEHDFGVCLPLHREPAERMHEIVRVLLKNSFHQKAEQSVDVIAKESSSAGLQHGSDLTVQKKSLGCSASETIIKEEVKEASITPAQRHVIFNSSSKSQGKKTSYPGAVKRANSIFKVSSLDSPTTAAGLTNGKKISNKLDSVSNRKLEARKYGSSPADNCMIQKLSLKTPVQRRNHQEPNEQPVNSVVPKEDLLLKPKKEDVAEMGKPECTIIKDSSLDASGHATDDSSEKKELSKFGLIINGKSGLKNHNCVPKERGKVLSLSLKPARKGRNLPRTVKPAGASSSDASKHAIGPKGKNKLSMIDSKVNEHKEVKEHNSTDQSIIFKSCLQHGGKESNISETVEHADHIVEFRSSALQELTEESDVNPLLSKGPDSPRANKIDPTLASFKIGRKRTKTPGRMKDLVAGMTDTEQKAADSLLELFNQNRKHMTKQHPKEEQKQKAKLAANDHEPNSSLPPKPQKQRSKREHQRKQKTKPDLNAAKEQGVAPDVNVDSTSQSQKKRKCQHSPALGETKKLKGLQITLAKLSADTAESTSFKDLGTTKFSFTGDPNNETPKCLRSPTLPHPALSGLNLDRLSLVDLKALAKLQNLRGYSKLTKADLAEELGLKLMVRGGCT